ncbi:hypothetical protein ACOSP7_018008 [Xanthoceras sorbifolium]
MSSTTSPTSDNGGGSRDRKLITLNQSGSTQIGLIPESKAKDKPNKIAEASTKSMETEPFNCLHPERSTLPSKSRITAPKLTTPRELTKEASVLSLNTPLGGPDQATSLEGAAPERLALGAAAVENSFKKNLHHEAMSKERRTT